MVTTVNLLRLLQFIQFILCMCSSYLAEGGGGVESLLSDVYHHSDGPLIRPLEDDRVGYDVNVIPLRVERYGHTIH